MEETIKILSDMTKRDLERSSTTKLVNPTNNRMTIPLIMSLHVFAVDPFYTYKIKDTVAYLHRTYPTIFHLTTPA